MRKTQKPIRPPQQEVWSDASGKAFPLEIPPVEVTLSFGYGSQFDEAELTLHYTDEEVMPLMKIIRENLSKRSQKELQSLCKKSASCLQDSMESRDYGSCELESSQYNLYDFLLSGKNRKESRPKKTSRPRSKK